MTVQRHDEIVRVIEDLIKSGRLKPGERLPSERYLAESRQVSRNTVREAIKALAEKGVVASRRGAGTYVAEGALACMIDGATRRRQRLREVFELRKILEPQIARLAARRISAEGLAALADVIAQQRKALEQGRDLVALDELFHRLLARATGNSVLFDLYETLHDVLGESRVNELQSPERNRGSVAHHAAIFQALQRQAAEEAEASMHQHMEQVEKNLRQPGDPGDSWGPAQSGT